MQLGFERWCCQQLLAGELISCLQCDTFSPQAISTLSKLSMIRSSLLRCTTFRACWESLICWVAMWVA